MPYIQNKKYKIMLELIKARQVEEKSLLAKKIEKLKSRLSEEEYQTLQQAQKAYTNYILRTLSYSTKIYVVKDKEVKPQISFDDDDFNLQRLEE